MNYVLNKEDEIFFFHFLKYIFFLFIKSVMSQDTIKQLEKQIHQTNTDINKTNKANENIKKYIKTQEQLHKRILEFELKKRRQQSDKLKQTVQDHQKRLRQVEKNQGRRDNNTVNTSTNNELQKFYKNQLYTRIQEKLKNCLN